jgi:hypothetical protein
VCIAKGRQEKQQQNGGTYLPTFLRFFGVSGLILEKMFMVFLGSSCRETAKNAIKQKSMERRQEKSFFFSIFFGQKFLTCIFPKKF